MEFDTVAPGTHPSLIFPLYKSTINRGPAQPPLRILARAAGSTGLSAGAGLILPNEADLTAHGKDEPLGEKIVVTGRVLDEDGKPVRDSLLEVWQANASGRYWHKRDQHAAPLDPNFCGLGTMLTDDEGRYRFVTIKPGPYPWGNHDKAWRPPTSTFRVHPGRTPCDPAGRLAPERHRTARPFAGLVSEFMLGL